MALFYFFLVCPSSPFMSIACASYRTFGSTIPSQYVFLITQYSMATFFEDRVCYLAHLLICSLFHFFWSLKEISFCFCLKFYPKYFNSFTTSILLIFLLYVITLGHIAFFILLKTKLFSYLSYNFYTSFCFLFVLS